MTNFVLTADQKNALHVFRNFLQDSDEKYMIIQGAAGCVDKQTEYLTPTGWKFISDYVDTDTILEWYPDGFTRFIKPKTYIKVPATKLIHLKTKTIDMMLSANHRMPYITSRGFNQEKTVNNLTQLSRATIPRFFRAPLLSGIVLSDALIRILIMQTVDGYIKHRKKGLQIYINVKKERKQKRAEQLLSAANIIYHTHKGNLGYKRYSYFPPKEIAFKNIQCLWQANRAQLQVAFNEIPLWDGSYYPKRNRIATNFTGNKRDADLVQYIFSTISGNYASIYKDKRTYVKEDIYEVNLSTRQTSRLTFQDKLSSRICTPVEIPTIDGYQYCFTTPSSFWLARRNGKIFPTGNSGKSTLITHLDAILDAQHQMYSLLLQKNKTKSKFEVLLSATTNKAVAVLDELTNLSARTIHSLLGLKVTFNPTTGERMMSKKNGYSLRYNKLVIIDESSMINEELFKIIDETFKDSKIVFIGDQYQLAPVKQKISIMESMPCTKVTMNKIMRNSGNILKTGAQFRKTVETGIFKPISLGTDIVNLEKKEYLEQIDLAFGSKKYIHNQAKVLTWTNDQALKYNSYIRAIKGYPLEFQKGETAITNNPIMSNGFMWPVDSAVRISQITKNACEQGVDGRYIEIESHVTCFMANNTYEQKRLLTALAKEKRWKDYYKIKENWLDLRSSYASTLHKSQGSTYAKVFIDLQDVSKCGIASDVARMLYVGISRATDQVIFYGELPPRYQGVI